MEFRGDFSMVVLELGRCPCRKVKLMYVMLPCRNFEFAKPLIVIFDKPLCHPEYSPENTFSLLQWWSMRNRYFQAWGKIEAICLQNNIAEI